MAPEQARGDPTTPSVDVFALGSLATFAVAGRPPFGVDGAVQVLYRVLNAPPDLDGCPPDLQQLIGRCLAKDPAQRPRTSEIIDACRARTADGGLAFERSWLPAAVYAVAVGGTAAPFAPLIADSGDGRQGEAAAESTVPSEIGDSPEEAADEGSTPAPPCPPLGSGPARILRPLGCRPGATACEPPRRRPPCPPPAILPAQGQWLEDRRLSSRPPCPGRLGRLGRHLAGARPVMAIGNRRSPWWAGPSHSSCWSAP